jgi:predicted nucleic acid-binding protein
LRTFLDSGVLITGWKGADRLAAIAIMEDPSREFYTSSLVRLELLPKAHFHRQKAEVEFYLGDLRLPSGNPSGWRIRMCRLQGPLGERATGRSGRLGEASLPLLGLWSQCATKGRVGFP